jgi:ribonuclease H / adenosylcobalamin/alpha-ribazole phosphatase
LSATILLIRHAAHDHVGKVLSGRLPGLSLSEDGRRQAERLASHLAETPITRLHTSPLQRARETAEAISSARPGLDVEEHAGLEEIDYGFWSGRSFAELDDDPHWARWNWERSTAVPPGGEGMLAAQHRAWQHVSLAAERYPDETIAMVSHCDIIRGVVAQVLALPLDEVHRFDVDPASVSRIVVGPWGARLLSLNEGAR